MSVLDGWIAMPMRMGSTWIALGLLRILGLPFELQGTTLVAPEFVFDVIPACSGSTTLRILVFLSALYIWTRPGWNQVRKMVGTLMAVPVALGANGLRLALLAGLGNWRGEPIEGLAHEWTGLLAFCIGLMTLLWISEKLKPKSGMSTGIKNSNLKAPNGKLALIGLIALIGALYSNLWIWLYLGWRDSPLDQWGWIYTGIGILTFIYYCFWCEAKVKAPIWNRAALLFHSVLLFTFLGLSFLSQVAGVNLLVGVACCCALAVLIQGRYGWAALHTGLPLISLIFIGFPTIPFIFNQFIQRVIALGTSAVAGQTMQALGAAGALIVAYIGWKKTRQQIARAISNSEKEAATANQSDYAAVFWKNSVVLWLLLGLAFKIAYSDFGNNESVTSKLRISYQLGDWRGLNQEPSRTLPGWRLGRNFWSRVYLLEKTNQPTSRSDQIGLLAASSEGNRHNLHPPEYCFTGSGWQITKSETQTLEFPQAGPQPVTSIQVDRDGKTLYGYFWYTDGQTYLADYQSVLLKDIQRRAMGETPNWFFFRILASEKQLLETKFWPVFEGELESGGSVYPF